MCITVLSHGYWEYKPLNISPDSTIMWTFLMISIRTIMVLLFCAFHLCIFNKYKMEYSTNLNFTYLKTRSCTEGSSKTFPNLNLYVHYKESCIKIYISLDQNNSLSISVCLGQGRHDISKYTLPPFIQTSGWIQQSIRARNWWSWIFLIFTFPRNLFSTPSFIAGAVEPTTTVERRKSSFYLFHQQNSSDRI